MKTIAMVSVLLYFTSMYVSGWKYLTYAPFSMNLGQGGLVTPAVF